MKKTWLALALIFVLFFSSLTFSASFFKQVSNNTLGIDYFKSANIIIHDNKIKPSLIIDWNKSNDNNWVEEGLFFKFDRNQPEGTDSTSSFIGLARGESTAGDYYNSLHPSIVKDENDYKMWYNGYDGSLYRIFMATSPDGNIWTKVNSKIEISSNTTGTDGRIPLGLNNTGDDAYTHSPMVLKDVDEPDSNKRYKMWYTGYDGGVYRIFMATSPDGYNWTKLGNSIPSTCDSPNPCQYGTVGIGSSSAKGDQKHVFAPSVIIDGATFKMWYSGYGPDNIWRIFMATSSDRGFTWTKVDNSHITTRSDTTSSNGKILLGTATSKGDYTNAYYPTIVEFDGDYYMFYVGINGSNYNMFTAISTDKGYTWEKIDNSLPGYLVDSDGTPTVNGQIPRGTSGKADEQTVLRGSVINDNNILKLWYGASRANSYCYYDPCENQVNYVILNATSTDGISWYKTDNSIPERSNTISTNSRLSNGKNISGDRSAGTGMAVIYDAYDTNDLMRYKMWYGGSNGTRNMIYLAYSSDGYTWTKYNNEMPIASNTTGTDGRIPLGLNNSGDDYSVYMPTVVLDMNEPDSNKRYKMWYSGFDQQNVRIYHATSPDGLTWTKVNNAATICSDNNSTSGRLMIGCSGSKDSVHVSYPYVIKEDGIYKMWYSGYGTTPDTYYRIFYATSLDGLTWTKYDNLNPIFNSNINHYGKTVTKYNGKYLMIYSYNDTDFMSLISDDGINWDRYDLALTYTLYDTNPNFRLSRSEVGYGDTTNIYHPEILKEGNKYRLYYRGYNNTFEEAYTSIFYAESYDSNWDNDLIGYWDFENIKEGYDNRIYDKSRGALGTLIGSTLPYLSNGFLNSNSLNVSTSHYFSIPYTYNKIFYKKDTNFSTSFWFESTGCSASDYLLERTRGFEIILCNSLGPNFGLQLRNSSNTIINSLFTEQDYTSGWHNVVVNFNNDKVELYVDANKIGEIDYNYLSSPIGTTTSYAAQQYNLGVGSNAYSFGKYDEFKIWDRQLSQQEILNEYNQYQDIKFTNSEILNTQTQIAYSTLKINSSQTSFSQKVETCGVIDSNCSVDSNLMNGLIALYHLNGNINDSSSNSLNGSVSGAISINGFWGTDAYKFDGTNDYAIINYNSLLAPNNVSVSAWFNTNNITSLQSIFSKTENGGYQLGLNNSTCGSGNLCFLINDGDWEFAAVSRNNLSQGNWHHAVGTYDGENVKLYLDGVLVNESSSPSGNINYTSNNPACIGSEATASNCIIGQYFNGMIEELGVWDRALTDQEVEKLFNAGGEKYSEIDINIYACNDASCNNIVNSIYLENIDYNTDIDISSLGVSQYFGFDAYFRPIENYLKYFFKNNLFIEDIVVTGDVANLQPNAILNNINNYSFSSAPYFSNNSDGNLDFNFSVFDLTNDRLLATLSYGNTSSQQRGNILVRDVNLDLSNCSSTNWNVNYVTCSIDFNIENIPTGEYYFKLDLNDKITDLSVFVTNSKIKIDNSGPAINNLNNTFDWKRNNVLVELNCSDLGSGCNNSTIRYKINNGDWLNYVGPFEINNDGNHTIYTDANDLKSNYSGINSFNVLVGYNGYLKTYSDLNNPFSFFVQNEIARIIYDVNLEISPSIKIIDSNGVEQINSLMSNMSNDTFFGSNDLNTYYFDFDINGSNGWYDVVIENQFFEDAFYKSPIWIDKYYDDLNSQYAFSIDLNLYEPNVSKRWFSLINFDLNFDYPAKESSIRLIDFNGSIYRELPVQIVSLNSESSLINSAKILSLITIDVNETKNLSILYSVIDKNKFYPSDFKLSNNNNLIDFNNSNFNLVIDINKGGVEQLIRSNIGTATDLNGDSIKQYAPYIQSGSVYRVISVSNPAYKIDFNGPIASKVNFTGSINVGPVILFNYDLNYLFFSKSNYYLVDKNIVAGSSSFWESTLDDFSYFNTDSFTDFSINGLTTENRLISGANTQEIFSNKNYYGLYNRYNLDAFGKIFLESNSSKSILNQTTIRDFSSNLIMSRIISEFANISPGDYFHTKTAEVIYNPLKGNSDLNNFKNDILNPLQYFIGLVSTNDSILPQINSINISQNIAYDSNNIYCSANISDDTVIDRLIMNISGPNIDNNYEYLIRSQSYDFNQLIDSNILNAGKIFCNIFIFDIANNLAQASVDFNIIDNSPPVIYDIQKSLDSNADIDPDNNLTFNVYLSEYSNAIPDLNIVYRINNDNNYGDWLNEKLDLNQQLSDFNYLYSKTITLQEGTYQYYFVAIDELGFDSNSQLNEFYSFYDYTWELTNNTSQTVSNSLDKQVSIGTIIVENTGDKNISFLITSDWDDKQSEKGIKYNLSPENTGYSFIVEPFGSQNINITTYTKTTERSDILKITINAIEQSSMPDNNLVSSTIVSLSDGPFMLIQFLQENAIALQSDTNLLFSAKLTNFGNEPSNNTFYYWEYPSNWILKNGLESLTINNDFNVGDSYTSTLIFEIPSDANTGSQFLTFNAGCCNNIDKNQSKSTQIIIVEKVVSGGDTGGDTGGSGGGVGGSGGGVGGSGGSGGGLGFTSEAQRDLFFQTSEFFELVRGEDSSFEVKVTNPLNGRLVDLSFSVSGIVSRYLNLKDSKVSLIDKNEEFVTSVEIVSPRYFSPGEYELVFTIDGFFVDDRNRSVTFTESRDILLLIHDTNRDSAQEFVGEIENFIKEFESKGFKLVNLPSLLLDANSGFVSSRYDFVKEKYLDAKNVYELALFSSDGLAKLESLIGGARFRGVPTPGTDRIFNLAKVAFERGDYALAVERLKEAELTYSLEVKGEFNLLYWLLSNWLLVISSLLALILAFYMFWLGVKIIWLKDRIRKLNSESDLLLTLIQGVQKRCFVENKMSIGEYYDALSQFESRLAVVSEDIVEFGAKLANVLSFRSAVVRLAEEKSKLIDLLKDTQKEYFDRGLIETRIYHTRVQSLTKRLSEVQEAIVVQNYKRTKRLNNKLTKYFWKEWYRGK